MQSPQVKSFFDEATYTVTHVVSDPDTGHAAIIDPVLDFDPASGRLATVSSDKVIRFARDNDLLVDWILETHVHADHFSGASYLREQLGGTVAIGQQVTIVQEDLKPLFNIDDLPADGRQFDRLFADGDQFTLGKIACSVIGTPGHTPACVTYVIGDAAFVGDTLFMPDFGTARTDFPGGDAAQLYDSIQKIFALPPETRLFMCHDYKAPGRDAYAWLTSVQEQRDNNIHVGSATSREDFVAMRESRDAELGMPKLLLPSIQVNIRGGELPAPESNGVRYLKLPIDGL